MTFQPCRPPLTPTGLPLCLLEPLQVNLLSCADRPSVHKRNILHSASFGVTVQKRVTFDTSCILCHHIALKACPKITYPYNAPLFISLLFFQPCETLQSLRKNNLSLI